MMHLPKQVVVADIMAEVVAKVSTEFNKGRATEDATPIQFYHESPIQFQNRLDERTKSGRIKFPCFVLFHDFPENRGGDYFDVQIPVIGIATLTKPEYLSDVRYELNYRPILYPLYQMFLIFLSRHPSVVDNDPNNISHRKWDRLYWGVIGKQTNDYLDAIELQNLKLTLKQFC
jgi:hypothetical protein